MKVVVSLVFSDKSRLWYPFHASSTVFFVCGGIVDTRLNELGVWCVSRSVALFNSCRSTVLRGEPSFFGATTIREHCRHCLQLLVRAVLKALDENFFTNHSFMRGTFSGVGVNGVRWESGRYGVSTWGYTCIAPLLPLLNLACLALGLAKRDHWIGEFLVDRTKFF